MADARRLHARSRQAVVEPCRGPISQVGADGLLDWREYLQQDEHGARERERPGQTLAMLHRANEHAHGNREECGQNAAQRQHQPPRDGQRPIGSGQDGEELPLFARS